MSRMERIKFIFEEEYEFLQEIERAEEEKLERKRRRKAEKQEQMDAIAVAPLSEINSVEALQEIERANQEKRERKKSKKAEKQEQSIRDNIAVATQNEPDMAEVLHEIERVKREKQERKKRKKAEKEEHSMTDDTAVAPLSGLDSLESQEERRERRRRRKAEKQEQRMLDDTAENDSARNGSRSDQDTFEALQEMERRERRRKRKIQKQGETITDHINAHADEVPLQEIENEQRIERKRKRKERKRENDENEEQPIIDDIAVIPSDPETNESQEEIERAKEQKRERKRLRKAEKQKQLIDGTDEVPSSEKVQSHGSDQGEIQLPSLPSPSGASSDLMLSGREDNETGRAVFMDRQLVVKTEEEVEEEEEVTILRFKKAKVSSRTTASQPQIKQEPVDEDNVDVKPPRDLATPVPVPHTPAPPAFDPAALFGAFASWMQQQTAAAAAPAAPAAGPAAAAVAAAAPVVPPVPPVPFQQQVPVQIPLALAPAAPAAAAEPSPVAAASPDNHAAAPSSPVARPVEAAARSNQRINPSIDNELLDLLSSCTPAKKKELISLIKGNTPSVRAKPDLTPRKSITKTKAKTKGQESLRPALTPRKSITRGAKTDGQESLRLMADAIIAKQETTRKRGAPKGSFGNTPRRRSQNAKKRDARDSSEKKNVEDQQKLSVKKRRMNDLDGEGSKEKITRKKNANNDEENEKFTDHDFWTGKTDQQTCPRCREHIGPVQFTRTRHYQRLHYDIFFAATSKSMGEVERFVGQQLGIEGGNRNEMRACLHCLNASLHKGRMELIDHLRENHPSEFESMKRKYKEVAENRGHTDTKVHEILMKPSTSVVRKRGRPFVSKK